ncbi:MAG: hypothetical protein A3A80_00450 [Candidatus Terrybacteria bacterium RIFCSPLOWO2_01_FULL_44_24]|uniref:Uncharacterized protein n=1 Tax=Candidatus Terrybacteria bacterium RIFCSPHIGHO2_01_FULL_43_35 TaxID=1802361 RepID=A0A1G2PDW2_9BACT|nr:MAG: hypothetical protein A2828_01430 [Candidatus Terrybacteria bacterium RIFCSPHIGHO2_01_FULL_43_35]OHA49605.1 MAG: hypothetical protein A3B75_00110 [Candidatus Terrybacteria bacterium RIFCSPHIGHO2_02_FULL_43_14]OHA51491.1 MAG: hypothetical protein A3A80_00450 [Candidatus Terrybacteria bacterium RIFCSPLOWO2_01_FULL_44_24]
MAINPEQYSKIGIEEAETRACTARVEEFKRVWEQLPSNIKQEVFAPDSAIGEFSALLVGAKPLVWVNSRYSTKVGNTERVEPTNPFYEIIKRSDLLRKELRTAAGPFIFDGNYVMANDKLIYNPGAVRRVIDMNKDLFEQLGYSTQDVDALASQAFTPHDGEIDHVAAGLLLGFPRADALIYAMKSPEQRGKLYSVLPRKEWLTLEGLAKKRFAEESTRSSKDWDQINNAYNDPAYQITRPEGWRGRYGIDVGDVQWVEFYETAAGEMRKEEIQKALHEYGLDEILAKMRREAEESSR